MKILQINNVYDFGSTGRITKDIHLGLLDRGFDSVVYYGRRGRSSDPGTHKICSEFYGKAQNGLYRITGIEYGGCRISTGRLLRAIKRESPDVVHLQCLNGHFVNVYRLLEYLKKSGIPTVLTLHAEFMYTGGCSHAFECEQWKNAEGCGSSPCPLYKTKMKSMLGDRSADMRKRMFSAFDGFSNLIVVSVSPWLENRAGVSSILKDKEHTVIYNGLDTGIFCSYPQQKLLEMRQKLGYGPDDKIVFHVSPSFDDDPTNVKGGFYLLRLAEMMPDVFFLVAGPCDRTLRVPDNVRLLGSVTEKEGLAMLYAMSDLTVLTSRRETFSMVCAESLCCGTPVVGFRAGAPELISLREHSSFCDFGDMESLSALVRNRLCEEKSADISTEAAEVYSKDVMTEKYIQLYRSLTRMRGD